MEEICYSCNKKTFAQKLANLEERLFSALSSTGHSLDKNSSGVSTTQSFSTHQALVLAERLALMSFPPTDYSELLSSTKNNMIRAPAPLDDLMSSSLLRQPIIGEILDPTLFSVEDIRATGDIPKVQSVSPPDLYSFVGGLGQSRSDSSSSDDGEDIIGLSDDEA